MTTDFHILFSVALFIVISAVAADRPQIVSEPVERGAFPRRVHVFEDYETQIEQRWWLRGAPESNNVPSSLSISVPNRRACRATETKDFDDKMGDPTKTWKAVIFNPVPGPPMNAKTRLSFRYWLDGTAALRVQIYSLSKGYHRQLTLANLPRRAWHSAVVDLTQARRPDGSGGPLSEDERIDDIQFYVPPEAELLIDDILLYEAASDETRLFPRRVIFTGWFDTGQQGGEWPGDFEIVKHEPPLTWKAARSVINHATGQPWIRVNLRGLRPLSERTRLYFRYRLKGDGPLHLVLKNAKTGQEWRTSLADVSVARWAEATVDFKPGANGMWADEVLFHAAPTTELLVDDLLLFEPQEP